MLILLRIRVILTIILSEYPTCFSLLCLKWAEKPQRHPDNAIRANARAAVKWLSGDSEYNVVKYQADLIAKKVPYYVAQGESYDEDYPKAVTSATAFQSCANEDLSHALIGDLMRVRPTLQRPRKVQRWRLN